jgi:hypothetical protein
MSIICRNDRVLLVVDGRAVWNMMFVAVWNTMSVDV